MTSTARKFECGLRLRKNLHRKLVLIARENGRSLNGEIEERLEASFSADEFRRIMRHELRRIIRHGLANAMLRWEASDRKKAGQ